MSFDLTNKNISDTYQNLLQKTGSNNQLFDLLGNPVTNLTIQGALIAQQYIVSSSVTNITAQQLSGSTEFGNSIDDTHQFTGNITASGNISASGTITVEQLTTTDDLNVGDDIVFDSDSAGLGRGVGQYGQMFFSNNFIQLGATALGAGIFSVDGHSSPGALFVSSSGKVGIGGGFHTGNEPGEALEVVGNISASGTIFANSGSFNYITASIVDVDGDTIRFGGEPFTRANIQTLKLGRSLKPLRSGKEKPDVEGDEGIFDSHVTASGNISASGIVFGSDIKSDGISLVKSITDLPDNTTNQGKIRFDNTAKAFVVKNISNLGSSDSPTFNNITASGDIFKTKLVQMTNSSSIINTFNTGSHKTCKYILQVTSASFIQSSEMLVVQHGSNVSNTEYAQINSGLNLLNFSSKITGENTEIIGSGSFISCSVKFVRTLI